MAKNSCEKRWDDYFCEVVLKTFPQNFEKIGPSLGEKLAIS